MLLTKLKARGFRSLKHVEVSFDQLTLLIGGNDTGKSSILDLLDIVLNDETLDADDFHHPPGEDEPVDTIEVILEFRLDPERDEEALQYALGDVLKIRKVYTLDGEETYYLAEYPADKRLREDDFEGDLLAEEQKDLIRAFDPSALDDLSNKQRRAEWLREYAQNAPQTQGWKEAPKRGWGGFLPRFYRYRDS
jgi:predicted ATP-dependent endonuclease of OLD family